MSPEVEAMLSEPLTAENMNTDAALRLFEAIMDGIRKDYILGKTELLRIYHHDLPEKEYLERSRGRSFSCADGAIRLYFQAKRSVMNGHLGIYNFANPEDVFSKWDKEVYASLPRGILYD